MQDFYTLHFKLNCVKQMDVLALLAVIKKEGLLEKLLFSFGKGCFIGFFNCLGSFFQLMYSFC